MNRTGSTGLVLTLALVVSSASARADDADAAAAEVLFRSAQEHMTAGRIAEACHDFGLSETLDSSVGALLNLGECHSTLGNTASAWVSFNKAAVGANLERESARRDYAKKRADKLEPILTKLELFPLAELPTDVSITRNGDDATLVVGIAVPVNPGEYLVNVSAPNHESWSTTIMVAGKGETVRVEIPELVEMEPEPSSEEAASSGNEAPSTHVAANASMEFDTESQRRRRRIALGVGGAGLAVTTTGLVFGVLAKSKLSHSEEHCSDDNVCDSIGAALVDETKTYANTSTVLVGVGAVALAAGVVLWITAPDPVATGDAHGWRAVPVAGPDSVGFAIAGGF